VLAVATGLVLTLAAVSCTPRRDPIRVERRAVIVENQSAVEWRQVEIWVNDHYRVTASSIAAGSVLSAPLDAFVAGFGQRFDPRRQSVTGIEVTATDAEGRAVTLVWGAGRRR
jgi:hypothetical protein